MSTERTSRENLITFNLKSRRARCLQFPWLYIFRLSSSLFTKRTKRAFLRTSWFWAGLSSVNKSTYLRAPKARAKKFGSFRPKNNKKYSVFSRSTWKRTRGFSLIFARKILQASVLTSELILNALPSKKGASLASAEGARGEKLKIFDWETRKTLYFGSGHEGKTWFESPPKAAKILKNTPSGALKTT